MKRFFLLLGLFFACAAAFADGGAYALLFETKKYVSFFDEPIEGKCLLASDASGKVRWQTLAPFVSAMIFDGADSAAFEFDNGKWKRVDMPSSRAVSEIMAGLKGVLSGEKVPDNLFSVSKKSGNEIVLTPKNPLMAKAIKSIKITGKPPKPEIVTIFDASGDRTEMRIKKSSFGSADLTGAFDISNPGSFNCKSVFGKE